VPEEPAVAVEDIAGSPAWFPLEAVGRAELRLVHLDEGAYQAASFLDQRIVSSGYPQRSCPLTEVESAAARLVPRAHYVFHTGHVGSTLISRLIGAHQNFFSLREPALLRALGAPPAPDCTLPSLATLTALLGRTWRAEQRSVVKVSSFLNELAEPLLAGADTPAAIFMYASPLAYLCGILAGPNSRAETRQLAPARLQRLWKRLGLTESSAAPQSEGEWIAMSWLCEMTTLQQAAGRFSSRVLWVNFDAFLREPRRGLQVMLDRLGVQAAASDIEPLVSGPLMRQYSKAPEYAYDAALRREVLSSAEQEHPLEIRRGMAWLQQCAREHPPLAAVLARS
jgi:hypothetical protein